MFGSVGKQLKQSNSFPNKIVRFGVSWLELWSRSKVKGDPSVPIGQFAKRPGILQTSVKLDMTAGRLR